jgi:RNA polymerase sigma factor (sigma-70 family)
VATAEQLVRDIQKAQAGGRPARDLKEELWSNCRDLVARLAQRCSRHTPQLRDDLASEAYLKFEQVLQTYSPDRGVPFRGYLSGCVQRHFIDRLRRKAESAFDFADDLPDDEAPIDRQLCGEELAEHVQSTVAGLLPRDRHRERKILAFRLRHFEGWSIDEIRVWLGADHVNTVSQWIHRVRKAFEIEFPRRFPEYFRDLESGVGRELCLEA